MPPKGSNDINARPNVNDDDDYVAQLLAQDAKNSSLKYSALGLQAYMPKRPTTGAPKPNTRFLKNILRSTDSHNAALKKKEEEEARERRRQQQTGKSRDSRLDQEDRHDDRRAKRRRVEDPPGRRGERERGDSRHMKGSEGSRHSDKDRDREHHRSSHRRRHGDDEKEAKTFSTTSRTGDRNERRHHNSRHKDEDSSKDRVSGRYDNGDEHGRHSRHRSGRQRRSHSRSPSRSRSPERSKRRRRDRDDDDHHRSHRRSHRSPSSRSASVSRDTRRSKHRLEPTSNHAAPERDVEEEIPSSPDSDPLSNLVGPLPPPTSNGDAPPVRSRGRGAYKPSAMDSHFADNYDPALDVRPDEDENDTGPSTKHTRRPVPGLATEDDDWDMALEALRDRALWKRNGADRLREAGFGDDVVDKWTSNGAFAGLSGGDKEKGVDDVRWTKKGEGREWDRGKVVDEDGHIDVKAAW